MDTAADRALSFRVFGNFHWPPVRTDYDLSTTDAGRVLLPGIVEIYYDAPSGTATRNAFLRWVPRTSLLPGDALPPFDDVLTDLPCVQQLSTAELTTVFAAVGPVALRLSPPGVKPGRDHHLLFRGALLFEQFEPKPDTQLPPLHLPLLRFFQQDGHTYFSEVVIGQKEDDAASGSRFRFNLALPAPRPQSGTTGHACFALPFGAIYKPTLEATESLPPVERFVAGPGPAVATQDNGGQGVLLTALPAAFRALGQFNFCAHEDAGNFLHFPRFDAHFSSFWPTSAEDFRKALLATLSDPVFVPGQPLFELKKPGGSNAQIWHSVRFLTTADQTTIIFRTGISAIYAESVRQGITKDLAVENEQFVLRMPGTKTWMPAGSDLFFDIELAYDTSRTDPWSQQDSAGAMRVLLGFTASVERDTGNLPRPDREHLLAIALDRANKAMHLARLGLRDLSTRAPQSFLPDILATEKKVTVRFALSGTGTFHLSQSEQPPIKWPQRSHRDAWPRIDFRVTLWPGERLFVGDNPFPIQIPISLHLPLFQTTTAGLQANLVGDISAGEQHSGYFQFRIEWQSSQPFKGRLGGFLIDASAAIDVNTPDDFSYWRFGHCPGDNVVLPGGQSGQFAFAEVDCRLRFAASKVRPVGTDRPWSDNSDRPAPLLMPTSDLDGSGNFLIDATEQVSQISDRNLTVSLYDRGDGATDGSLFVILSEQPFGLMRVTSQPLQQRGSQDGALVATYSSTSRFWQVKLTNPTYHYELPPQVAAESMDKPRRLEILDEDLAAGRPIVSPRLGATPVPPALDTVRRRAIEFRLTPSTELWVQASDVDRGFALPEWAAHDLFTQRGEFGLGSALNALRGEFLYGLSVGVDVGRESGAARGARVAELEALTGRPPLPTALSNGEPNYATRWRAIAAALARRPERVEVWAREPGSSGPIELAKFASGVQFALRKSALHRPPLEGIAEHLDSKDLAPRISNFGLSGGALWPIESRNFFNQLIERPVSDGGTLERVALSPIGGDADQTARFVNQLLQIISETRNGFVQRHKVEIIGRIGVFWHRAKHVVVYERTVSPSAQFTPDTSESKRSRRPILRKVSEYIELLQPERSYPDFTAATPTTCGFLRAVRFNRKTINVDSAWSEDVGTFGWKIPLWNREAARQRPQVYPRPDIGFVTAAEGEGDQPQTTQECLEPDNIYFFADATASGPDTDTWIARRGVDFGSLPAPKSEFERALPDTDRSRKSSAPRIPRGHRRYTWRLGPASQKTAINAARADEPLFTRLDSITFMRANALDPADPAVAKLSGALAASADLQPPQRIATVEAALAAFVDSVDHHPENVTTTATTLFNKLTGVPGLLDPNQELGKYIDQAGRFAKGLESFADEGPSRCHQAVDDFIGSIKRKQQLVLEVIRNWGADASHELPQPGDHFADKSDLVKNLTARLITLIDPALTGLSQDIGSVDSSVQKTNAIIGDVKQDVETLLTSASTQVDALKTSYDKQKPWSAQRLLEIHQKLATVRDGIVSDVDSTVNEAQSRLTLELDRLAHSIGTAVAQALTAINADNGQALFKINSTENAAQSVVGIVDSKLALVLTQLGEVDGKLGEAIQLAQQSGGQYTAMLTGLRDRATALRTSVANVRTDLQTASANLNASVDALEAEIANIVAGATSLINDANAFAMTALQQIATLAGQPFAQIKQDLTTEVTQAAHLAAELIKPFQDMGDTADAIVARYASDIKNAFAKLPPLIDAAFKAIEGPLGLINTNLNNLKTALSHQSVLDFIGDHVVNPAVTAVLSDVDDAYFATITKQNLAKLQELLQNLSSEAQAAFERLSDNVAADILSAANQACKDIGSGLQQAKDFVDGIRTTLMDQAQKAATKINNALGNPAQLIALAQSIAADVGKISDDLSKSYSEAHAYADRVTDAVANLGSGGLAAAPSNILKLYAAAASAPALPNLDYERERLAYYYNQLNNIVDTTPVAAWFGRLGEELKALGLSLPFRQIGSRLLPDDLSQFDISRVFKNFSGLKLDQLFQGYKLPPGVSDAIKVTHAFDAKQARAWVQIDLDLTLGGHKSLFSIGPVQLDFVDSRLLAQVRLEASKDTDRVEQSGRATLMTDVEVLVGGQSMVTLQKVALTYDRGSGLKVDFDPRNIRLNAIFQFIQETLGSIFPDEVGGMKVLKDTRGLPIGVEHEFSMPPISLMYGTSGVSNLQIANRFALVAFPDFVISDRFNLSRPELPFIFSLFIIGGTGYVTVDAEYRPFKSELMVNVEAAAGGSASIGFAFGPVSGAVVISLSLAIAYRKLIGKSGGGLTVSLVLLVAGTVNVAGIIDVYIGLLLRMAYQDSGRIDGTGTLTVSIRITCFFKLTVRANATYRLRDGKSTTTHSASIAAFSNQQTVNAARQKAAQLLEARG